MKHIFWLIFCVISSVHSFSQDPVASSLNNIVLETKQLILKEFPNAYNPSIIGFRDGYILTFRYTPYQKNPAISYIGIVLLNDQFDPISNPELLLTRDRNSITQSQSEDARLFSCRDRIFIIYNDNIEKNNPETYERRDIFIAELVYNDDYFSLLPPTKMVCHEKLSQMWQKNWVPFEWNHVLYLTYSISPHEVMYVNLSTGACYSSYVTFSPIEWRYGTLRGSSAATLVDGEYLAFFHSGTKMASSASNGEQTWHYFMGAYTFSSKPPFETSRISPHPITGPGFYAPSQYWKKIIFPGGYIVRDPYIYVAYGRDDGEMWIAKMDKKELMASLVSVKNVSRPSGKSAG